MAAGFFDFEAFFFGDFWAAGFFAVDFLADLAPFFFGDFLVVGLAAFFFLAIAKYSFTSKRPVKVVIIPAGATERATSSMRTTVRSDAARLVRAGIVSSLAESSQGESAVTVHVSLGIRKLTIA